MNKKKIAIICGSVLLIIFVAIVAYKWSGFFDKEVIAQTPDVIEDKTDRLNIKMVGDDLIHNTIYFAAKTEDSYNFDMLFEQQR